MSQGFDEEAFRREFGAAPALSSVPKANLAAVFTTAARIASRNWLMIALAMFGCISLPKLALVGIHLFFHATHPDGDPLYDLLWQLDNGIDYIGYVLWSGIVTFLIVIETEHRRLAPMAWARGLVQVLIQMTFFGIGVLLGFALLVIPGIILFVLWFVSSPAMIRDNLTIFGSFSRSRDLIRGNFWPTLLIVGVSLMISYVFGWVFDELDVAINAIMDHQHIEWMIRAVFQPLADLPAMLLPIALYYHLVEIREGLPREPVADVFD